MAAVVTVALRRNWTNSRCEMIWKDDVSRTSLPPDSLYARAVEEIRIVGSGEFAEGQQQNVDHEARAVVKNPLKQCPNLMPWTGGGAFLLWFLDTFFWATFFGGFL
jgi:hypothetical protein